MMGAVAGLSAKINNQLKLAIDQIQKLNQQYTTDLQKIATTGAAFQKACEVNHASLDEEINLSEETQARSSAKKNEMTGARIDAERDVEGFQENFVDAQSDAATDEQFRTKQAAEYATFKTESDETVKALRGAKDHFSAVLAGTPDGSFIQLPKKVKALIQQRQSPDDYDLSFDAADPDAGGQKGVRKIAEIVNDLYNKAAEEERSKTSEENQAKQNYAVDVTNSRHMITMLEKNIQKRTQDGAEFGAQEGAAAAALATSVARERELRKEFVDSENTCAAEKATSTTRQSELRTAISATTTAVEALSARAGSFIQASSLLQLHRTLSTDDVRDRLSEELFSFAKRYSSPAISNIAMAVKASGLDNVKGMIQDLIKSLQSQVTEMTSFHEQCNQDLTDMKGTLEQSQDELAKDKDTLATIEAEMETDTEDLKDEQQGLAERTQASVEKVSILTEQIATYKAQLAETTETLAVINDVINEFNKALVNPAEKDSAQAVLSVLQTVESSGQDDKAGTAAALSQSDANLSSEKNDFEKAKSLSKQQIEGLQKSITRGNQDRVTKQQEIESETLVVKAKSEALTTKTTMCNGGTREDKHEAQMAGRAQEIDDLKQALEILNDQ